MKRTPYDVIYNLYSFCIQHWWAVLTSENKITRLKKRFQWLVVIKVSLKPSTFGFFDKNNPTIPLSLI